MEEEGKEHDRADSSTNQASKRMTDVMKNKS